MNLIFSDLDVSIFETMSRLASDLGAVNLGQGFPEGLEPQAVVEAGVRALAEGPHQYPPMRGLPELRQAVGENARRFFNLDVNWQTEVIVTSGATEALAASFLAVLNPGDEVILLEPAYDSYRPLLSRAGAIVVPVQLDPPHWRLPEERLRAAISAKTRAIVLNAPMNPTGKLFDRDELSVLAGLIAEHGLIAICDEVYEHLTFDGQRHVPLMSLPGMRDHCVRIGSAGKSFSVTGWKVGYITAAPALLEPIARAHQFITFTTPPALQLAAAFGLRLEDGYFSKLASDLQERRDLMAKGLQDAGFTVLKTAATYFLNIDISAFVKQEDDIGFTKRLLHESGVATIPLSAFYGDKRSLGLVRLCFAKSPETVALGVSRLGAWLARTRA
jgi:N-succinyldiaminopimelate aminotransferase